MTEGLKLRISELEKLKSELLAKTNFISGQIFEIRLLITSLEDKKATGENN